VNVRSIFTFLFLVDIYDENISTLTDNGQEAAAVSGPGGL